MKKDGSYSSGSVVECEFDLVSVSTVVAEGERERERISV